MNGESLLAPEANDQTQGDTTTQGEPGVDTQAAPEQKQVEPKTPPPADDTDKPTPPKPADQADEGKAADAAPKAPEVYDFQTPRDMPEGFKLEKPVVDSFAEVARELDLSQEDAQKVLDKVVPAWQARIEESAKEHQEAIHEKWTAEAKADKELTGGDGFERNIETAKRALQAYGSDGLHALLSGPLGSHPEVVRFLMKVGATVSEDKFAGGTKPGEGSVDLLTDESAMARKLYPSSQ